jgi:hypothetical protein
MSMVEIDLFISRMNKMSSNKILGTDPFTGCGQIPRHAAQAESTNCGISR